MCIVTSFLTVALYHALNSEFKVKDPTALIVSSLFGLILAYILRRSISRQCIGDIAEISIVDVSFVDTSILKVGDFQGLTNVALKEDREKYLKYAVGIKIMPRDNSYKNASIFILFKAIFFPLALSSIGHDFTASIIFLSSFSIGKNAKYKH